MSKSLFWKMMDGELPLPAAALTLGATITHISRDEGTITVEFEGKPEFANPVGTIQGGFLAAMLDDTMGPALTATLPAGEFAPTLELKTSFFAPATVGKLVGYGRVVARGGSVCFLEGELKQGDKLVARASATAIIKKISR
ncbi:PaaI family thioesterase [Exilibacterium tricleocarpae]|uniref:PaaI family thioesterase n=1 Tax=Exilibacterium tricleocarpae TaxID=2591008 RepID=A0A545SYV4_9GAMM|nr:PaaI family thioesterase [Exilibacterium tricleocarpae]TQV70138.1 PaaI family thioesterase [Exilibacterium tricleocarpae]